MAVLTIIFTLAAVWLLSNAYALFRNRQTAAKSGLPLLTCIMNPSNILYLIFNAPMRPYMEKILPAAIFDHILPTVYGWEFFDRYALHEKFGWTFILATPGPNIVWTADPDVASQILTRRKDFNSLYMSGVIMGLFGPNVITTDGETWQRHRRIVAPNLNERISALVWEESADQAQQMLEYSLDLPNGTTDKSLRGLRSIAFNVLGQIAYGQPSSWTVEDVKPEIPGKLSYFEAVQSLVNNVALAAVVPTWIFQLPFWPQSVQTLGLAVKELPAHTELMLEKEREILSTSNEPRDNLMSMLVRLSDQEKNREKGEAMGRNAQYLSEEEISGNLYLFTVAGMDTTANSLAYAFTMLAIYPEWQQWIFEELDAVLKEGNMVDYDYTVVFPKLTRCLAVMLEILRLYTPVQHISRQVYTDQMITSGMKTYYIPANTQVYINNTALHTNPKHWGPDSLEFKPSRWIAEGSTIGNGNLIIPAKGTFLPWSGGPRVCPGQKMSQVEFVSVLATIFRSCSIAPALADGESHEQGKEMLQNVIAKSRPALTLQMTSPEQVKLRWSKR